MQSLIRLPSPFQAWAHPVAAPSLAGLRLWCPHWTLTGPWLVARVSRTTRLHRNPHRLVVPRSGRGARSWAGASKWRPVCFHLFCFLLACLTVPNLLPHATGPLCRAEGGRGSRWLCAPSALGASNGRVWGLMYKPHQFAPQVQSSVPGLPDQHKHGPFWIIYSLTLRSSSELFSLVTRPTPKRTASRNRNAPSPISPIQELISNNHRIPNLEP